jgi:membrane protease YdiL (CAAX protease family)
MHFLPGSPLPGYNCASHRRMKESSSVLASAGIPFPSANPAASRTLSAFEFCLGVFIVIGHNVFHIVPNEVIILSILGLVSIRLRDGSWSAMGLKQPASWRRLFLIALVAAILRILLGQFLIEPVTGFFWPKPIAPALANEITGKVKIALVALLLVWTFAAFSEEIAYRGYLLTRAADIGRRSVAAYWIGIVLVSILFGYGHYYKGASGMIDSGFAGLILGSAYMVANRNLWASILAHGFIDTFGVIDAFFGWSN